MNPSVRFGAGHSGLLLLAALLVSPPCAGELSSTDWIDDAAWPFAHSVQSGGDAAMLAIVEQAGIDIGVRLADGEVSNTPLGRMGPEFIYVPRGESVELLIEPLHAATGRGRFRFTYLPLTDEAIERLGRLLADAGKDYGSRRQDRQARACARYSQISEISGLDQAWSGLGKLIGARCYFATGQEVPALLVQRGEPDAFLSVMPYHADWLDAELSYVALEYHQVIDRVETALRKADTAMTEFPDRQIGIGHDIAEMRSLLGGSAAMAAFVAGGDNTPEGRNLFDTARRELDRAISEARELGDAQVTSRAYDFRAAMHFVNEEHVSVIDDLLTARAEAEKTGDPTLLVPILGSIGDFHKRWGELRAAQDAYLAALGIVGSDTANGSHADTFQNAGTFYYDLGDFPRARSYVEKSIQLSRQTRRDSRAYNNTRQLAMILAAEGDYPSAKKILSEGLEYFVRIDVADDAAAWPPYRIMMQSELSRVEHELGNTEEALRLSNEAIAQIESRSINVATDLASAYINHANLLFALDRKDAALRILDETIDKYSNEPIEMVDLLAAKLTLLHRSRSTEHAIAVANRAFEIIESQRTEIDAVRLGPYWSGKTNAIYAAHIDYLLHLEGYESLAFAVAERARATSLRLRRLEMLLARNETNSEARAELINIVSEIQRSYGASETEDERVAFERRLTEAQERYFASHGARSEAAHLDVLSLEELRDELPDDVVLLEFVTGPRRVWRFDVSRGGWSVTAVGDTADVRAAIDAALYELSNPYVRDRGGTTALSAMLLRDLSVDLSGADLLISPSDSLNTIPFAALQLDGSVLSELAPITLVPSFSEYFADDAARRSVQSDPDRLELALLADPAFEDLASPSPLLGNEQVFRDWAASLQRLPASALEARELASHYAEDRSLVLTGTNATQRNFFDSRVTNARIIHIATHGYFNENVPELVGFAMAKAGPDDDGFVSQAEISSQSFAADLVVISACNTGRGFEIAGEGNMSLARTFLAQGVDSVVSTLWPVSDAATATFMKEFYRALNEEGQSLAQALRSAQRLLRQSRFRAPAYWSGYTLTTASRPPDSLH